jgi:hypothetical protein
MTLNTTHVRIRSKDLDKLRVDCKLVYLRDNPECDGDLINDAYLLHRVINFYLNN